MNVVTETPRLAIRWWEASDEEALAAIYGDGNVMRYIGEGYPNGFTREQTKKALSHMVTRSQNDRLAIWAVVLKETNAVIGACGLVPLEKTGDIEIAFIYGKPSWGKGYAYEAACAVHDYGFTQLQLPRIVAVVNPFNARSIALINRLGMRFEHVVRAYKNDLLKYTKSSPIEG